MRTLAGLHRTRTFLACPALAALALCLLPQAHAGAQAPTPWPLSNALAAARAYWRAPACAGHVAVRFADDPPPSPAAGMEVVAWVTFDTPLGPESFSASPATFSGCTVNVSSRRWTGEAAAAEDYARFCQMMVHEVGHLLGWPDSRAYGARDIRYPVLSAANLPSVCTGPPHAGRLRVPRTHGSFER
ncbi:MAG: hypothetical protein ACYDA6_10270 [Solirubrobacteraceae bacterium]